MIDAWVPEPDHPARDELFSDFERATDRLERSTALGHILEAIGVEEPTYEDVAKIQRWADGYNSMAFDALIAKGWRRNALLTEAETKALAETATKLGYELGRKETLAELRVVTSGMSYFALAYGPLYHTRESAAEALMKLRRTS